MRLLLDEDSLGRLFVRLLQAGRHDVETVTDAGLTGKPDPEVFAHAKQSGRVLLTRNGKDFLPLHEADPDHTGILVEHQDADPAKNMTSAQIVEAIGKIDTSGWDINGEFVSVNAWR